MRRLQALLVVMLVGVVAYAVPVVLRHGLDFPAVFVRDVLALGWPGQFNLDFLCLLVLAALWLAWRDRFAPAGLLKAGLTLVGGTPVLCAVLLLASRDARGDLRRLLLGRHADGLRG
jgi:hypothetical protein